MFVTERSGLEEITYNLQESQVHLSLSLCLSSFLPLPLSSVLSALRNLQDFFEASLDGRLRRFHQIEKCMIKGMLQAIRKYPEDNPRRKVGHLSVYLSLSRVHVCTRRRRSDLTIRVQHVEEELKKDLEYVEENMKEDPKRIQHKERMRAMHRVLSLSLSLSLPPILIPMIFLTIPGFLPGPALATQKAEGSCWHCGDRYDLSSSSLCALCVIA
jgi:hypothetical protein